MSIKITLNKNQLKVGARTGSFRHIESLEKGLKHKHGKPEDKNWEDHIEGACGEYAAALALREIYEPTVNTFKAPDLLSGYQVRTRSRHYYDLIVRKNDSDDEIFILVTGQAPNYVVRGWLHGCDAKKEEWFKDYGNRPPAYFVPESELHSIEELIKK